MAINLTQENKNMVQRFIEEGDKGNVDAFDDMIPPDAVDHSPFPGQPAGREGVKYIFRMLKSAFPDMRTEVHEMVAEGDRVAVRSRIVGTHQGEFMGVPASGKPVSIEGIDILRFENGKMVEHWGVYDAMGMMMQIGAIPTP
jgi:steroid delta-isomerase-like uncharacterized protein